MMLRRMPVLFALLLVLAACGQDQPTREQAPVDKAADALKDAGEVVKTAVSRTRDAAESAVAATRKKVPAEFAPFLSQLQSVSPISQRDAAKKIYKYYGREPLLLEAVNREVLKGFNHAPEDKYHVDAMAWMIKVLINSGDGKYRKTLQTVADRASSPKLQRYARKGLAQLY